MRLVADLVEQVVEPVEGLDHTPYVGFLESGDPRLDELVHLDPFAIPIEVAIDADHQRAMEQETLEAANMALPEEEDEL